MVVTRSIGSVEDPDDPHPWYDVEVNNGQPEILADKDGGLDGEVTGAAAVPDFADLPDPARRAMSSDVVYAVTEAGEFIAYEAGTDLSEHGVSLRAHLGWYDSEADEFTVLEFTEG